MDRSLVLVKPEGVEKKLVGEIIGRFEGSGLRIIALKMLNASRDQAEKHYVLDKEWYENMWANTKKAKEASGQKVSETALEMGTRVRDALVKDLTRGPIVAIVVEGNDAIKKIREMAGATSPDRADPKSIRGMHSKDSYEIADREGRAVRNIVHASDSVGTANREIPVWFKKGELIA